MECSGWRPPEKGKGKTVCLDKPRDWVFKAESAEGHGVGTEWVRRVMYVRSGVPGVTLPTFADEGVGVAPSLGDIRALPIPSSQQSQRTCV